MTSIRPLTGGFKVSLIEDLSVAHGGAGSWVNASRVPDKRDHDAPYAPIPSITPPPGEPCTYLDCAMPAGERDDLCIQHRERLRRSRLLSEFMEANPPKPKIRRKPPKPRPKPEVAVKPRPKPEIKRQPITHRSDFQMSSPLVPLSVSVHDAAVLTGVSQYEIRKAINAGELKARRRGVRILIPLDELNAWLKSLPTVVEKDAS